MEIGLPLLFLVFLLLIKMAVEDRDDFAAEWVPAYKPGNDDVYKSLSFHDYVTALVTERTCLQQSDGDFYISGIANQGYNWQVPFVKCDSRKCQKDGEDAQRYCEYGVLALAGTNEGGKTRAEEFKDWLYDRYPELATDVMPFNFKFVKDFDSIQAMDEYVKKESYGDSEHPKISLAVVWEGNDAMNYNYLLRPNSTNFNTPEEELNAQPAVHTTPDTDRFFASYAKNDEEACETVNAPDQGTLSESCTGLYLYNGVLTLQRLVGDFILNKTGAVEVGYSVAESGTAFVQFPAPSYLSSGFFDNIQGTQY